MSTTPSSLERHATLLVVAGLTLLTSVLVAAVSWGGAPRADRLRPIGVENVSSQTLVVHVATDGIEWRLGQVGPGERVHFELPSRLTSVDTYRVFVSERPTTSEGT